MTHRIWNVRDMTDRQRDVCIYTDAYCKMVFFVWEILAIKRVVKCSPYYFFCDCTSTLASYKDNESKLIHTIRE